MFSKSGKIILAKIKNSQYTHKNEFITKTAPIFSLKNVNNEYFKSKTLIFKKISINSSTNSLKNTNDIFIIQYSQYYNK